MAIAEIHVTLKPTLLDAQGATVLKALHNLGHTTVQNVRIGKYITVEVNDALLGPALQQELDKMCTELLANPVIEDYEITVGAEPGAPLTAATVLTRPASVVATTPTAAAPLANFSASAASPPSALTVTEQIASGQVSPSDAGTPDPLTLEYSRYEGLPAPERLALQELAWQKHGNWIVQQLNDRRAAWILCVGGEVVQSGVTLDSMPSEAQRDKLGTTRNLVPWIFTRPPS